MLSYQHAYHAGGPADLHKHIALAELLVRLTAKPRGISYMETHAGRGLYDLAGAEAARTGEAARGIRRVEPAPGSAFGAALRAVRSAAGATTYPGSPAIARALLRPQDRLTLIERHPAEHAALRRALDGPGVAIHRRDGFEGVLALSPPVPRRGLVLVDPSYEVKTEFAAVAGFVHRLVARWPEAVVLVWYPILPAGRHADLLRGLAPLPVLTGEVDYTPRPERGMTGSGLALINAPHGTTDLLHAAVDQAAPILVRRKESEHTESTSINGT